MIKYIVYNLLHVKLHSHRAKAIKNQRTIGRAQRKKFLTSRKMFAFAGYELALTGG